MSRIAVIVGSLRKDSINLKLARALETLSQGKMDFIFVPIGDLPLFNQDLEASAPESVTIFKKSIDAADGVLFVTPEYNRSIPGGLKNAIDWGSRPYGHSSWSGKPAAIAGASPGAIGTAVAQNQLRAITAGFLDMPTMGQPEMYFGWKDGVIADDGSVTDERTKAFLQSYVDKFADWVETHRAAQKKAA